MHLFLYVVISLAMSLPYVLTNVECVSYEQIAICHVTLFVIITLNI